MKQLLFVLACSTLLMSCQSGDQKATPPVASGDSTTIEWKDANPMNVGTAKAGQVVEVAFHFKNTGNKPLVISDVTAPCGCTIPDKTKNQKPYAPGEEGVIQATFNSKGYSGVATKSINVIANTKPASQHDLTFSVQVNE